MAQARDEYQQTAEGVVIGEWGGVGEREEGAREGV